MRSTSGPGTAGRPTVHVQRFTVAYEYPVYFTERLFDPANPVLVDAVARLEPERRHRCLVFVDDGLLGARPDLRGRDRGLLRHHAARMTLVAPPIPVPGGERVKNELFFVEQMQRQVFEHAHRPPLLRDRDRRRRDARRGRPGRRDHPPRRPPDPGADHGARPGRFRRRRQERRQPVRRQELLRHLRAAVRGAERPRPADPARRARQDRRHGRGGEGRADPRRRRSSPGWSATPTS